MERVKDPDYHDDLQLNYVFFRHPQEQPPNTVAAHVARISSKMPRLPKLSPEIVAKAIYELDTLGLGCNEGDIRKFCNTYLFPKGAGGRRLLSSENTNIARHLVPNNPVVRSVVSRPRPELLYGYPTTDFAWDQSITLSNLHPQINNYAKAATKLFLPFFTVEFKAAAGTGGSLWVAANQCAGASAACIKAVNQVNTRLGDAGCIRRIHNVCYSLAIDNNLAQLFKKDKEGNLSFYIQRVDCFLLLNPEQFSRLHQWAMAILHWGQGERLRQIRFALDYIQSEQQMAE
ncbi:hypothetical protein B0T24DRAFT_583659 [Lasiosphaeria ovina]|uniref:DUF7924 domain-containing protein n=1 Tax=Lasiosphaeria ovina TaxID=92902 RepID=A0AAE0JV26_9PEZI|nr:hypothetical protein B0T24DRAFT_583659 [Lasiosphaeria ovina]